MTDWWKPLVGVLIGWMLGQLSQWWREKLRTKKLYRAIYIELRDVQSTLRTRIESMKEAIVLFLRERDIRFLPTQIDFSIFGKYFPECLLEFSESERLSLSHIFGRLTELNRNLDVMRQNWDFKTGDADRDGNAMRIIVQKLEVSYLGAKETDEMISMLLEERRRFDIRANASKQRLVATTIQVEKELRELVQQHREG